MQGPVKLLHRRRQLAKGSSKLVIMSGVLPVAGSSEALRYMRKHNQRFYEHQVRASYLVAALPITSLSG